MRGVVVMMWGKDWGLAARAREGGVEKDCGWWWSGGDGGGIGCHQCGEN
ncbi:hypothetical protein Acr_01g0014650 [Actinidia rufa]|uniref:Uncharacterized protein n=1 Tax=Actinidia rufa TaxID=165716 RepID=A0A7J0E7M3_9ERIC|nr:hypothetical protein Acr_01g0014650 [Actinidia rufa]